MNQIVHGESLEVLKTLPDGSVNCCVTSPPYWGLRDYGVDGQIGLEKTPEEYASKMVEIFGEVRRVLRDDGTLWLNLGDSYNGGGCGGRDKNPRYKQSTNIGSTTMPACNLTNMVKPKDLLGIPWRVAFALQADGWYLRSDIIWHKPNPMPESVTDRPTKSHEYIFLMSKSGRYYYDADAIKELAAYDGRNDTEYKGGPKDVTCGAHERWTWQDGVPVRNKRSVWTVTTKPFEGAHFATFPEELIKPCILAGCPEGGTVLDPFMGAGTVALVALKLQRQYLGIELKAEYVKIAESRIADWTRQQTLGL